MLQITDLEKEQKILPILRLGFRPFFLAGTMFSLFAVIVWLFIFTGTAQPAPLGGGYWWHIHEMIYGFGCAIIAGFLLTAVQTWTGLPGIRGQKLLSLVLLWFVGRVALFAPELIGVIPSQIIDLAFLPVVAYVLGRPIIAIKQYRNLFFVPLLLLFSLANLEMHLSLHYPDNFSVMYAGYAGVMLVTFLMSVMAGRVTPMFTANGTKTTRTEPIPLLDKITNGSLAVLMLLLLLHPLLKFNSVIFGSLLLFSGFAQFMRWLRWRPWITVKTPLLWSLHGAVKFISLGLILLGLSYLIPEMPSQHSWHLLTIGGMGGLILAMISRVSLGHTGRQLSPPPIMSLAFILISISALLRTLGPWFMPMDSQLFYQLSAYCWIIAFGLFVWFYGPMLCQPRIDKRPG